MDLDFIFTDISSIMQTDLHLETDSPDKQESKSEFLKTITKLNKIHKIIVSKC